MLKYKYNIGTKSRALCGILCYNEGFIYYTLQTVNNIQIVSITFVYKSHSRASVPSSG